MATHPWQCEMCHYIGPTGEFEVRDGHQCPKEVCKSEDVFPLRIFRCKRCKFEAEQGPFFASEFRGRMEDAPLDPDPIKEGWDKDWACSQDIKVNKNWIACCCTEWEQVA